MSVNDNNNPPNNMGAASSTFGHSIPPNPNLFLNPSIYGPQQQVMSVNNNNNAGASSSPFAQFIPSNPNADLQPQPQSTFGPHQQVNPPQNAGASSIFGQSMPSNPTAHLKQLLISQSIFRRQQRYASITNQLQISSSYTRAITQAKTKDEAIALAHAQLQAQLQAINQSQYASPDQPQPNINAHINGGNSVNSGGNGCNPVQGQSSSTHTTVDDENINESNPSAKRARMEIIPENETVLYNEADHAGGMDAKQKWSPLTPQSNYGTKKSETSQLGFRGRNVPTSILSNIRGNFGNITPRNALAESLRGPDGQLPHKLRNIEPRILDQISNEIMDVDPNVRWDDIAGLDQAKKCVNEMVIWPLLRPDIFKGCRSPGRGLLLFGPPGTGKTMIGKAIAGEAKATFFYISASSITSKWLGESEKLVRALFGVASCRQPAVIFVDEIDSLLSKRRSDSEHESSRRIKTQLLIEMEGFNSGSEQVLFIGATNRPQDLDEAARRRLTKRFYIPLPSSEARASIVRNVLNKDDLYKLSTEDIDSICKLTEGYSGSDMTNLVKDASMGPIREALKQGADITKLNKEDMRPVSLQDFEDALQDVRPSVSVNELGTYEEWNKQFGSLKTSSN